MDTRHQTRIVDALGLQLGDFVVEIGPGRGAMTALLASRANAVAAVEVDQLLAAELAQRFQEEPKVEIIHADFLAADLGALCERHQAGQCFVFGNLPYYITSPIIHHLLEFAGFVRAAGLLVQWEVANRLAASPGSRDYGYLTVWVQLFASPRVVLQVPPGAFSPPPKVRSALVCLDMHPLDERIGSGQKEQFQIYLKQCFAYKRKKLLNCLAEVYPRQQVEESLGPLGLPLRARAEELSPEDLIALYSSLSTRVPVTCGKIRVKGF